MLFLTKLVCLRLLVLDSRLLNYVMHSKFSKHLFSTINAVNEFIGNFYQIQLVESLVEFILMYIHKDHQVIQPVVGSGLSQVSLKWAAV